MRKAVKRGASLVTYGAVVGLVALGASLAVSHSGEQVSGITSKIAGSVNAVDGAISGNQGPAYQGGALADQGVDAFDPIAPISARGFLDPEGDALSYSLALTGDLLAGDFTTQHFADGVVVTGTPTVGGRGTLSVVATDPIGRTAVAGPVEITVGANRPPSFTQWAPDDLGRAYANRDIGTYALGVVSDLDDDSIDPVVVAYAGNGEAANFQVSGTNPVELAGRPEALGPVSLTLSWSDEHGEATTVGPFSLDVQVDDTNCKSILETGGSSGDGVYALDPQDDGTSFDTYCDMTTEDGGWTLVGTMADDGNHYWTWDNVATLYQGGTTGSAATALGADFQSEAWSELAGDELLLRHAAQPGKYLRYDSVLGNETLASKYTATNTAVGVYYPNVTSGSWFQECGGDLAMYLQRADDDGNGWDHGSKGFIWRSVDNHSCYWDDTAGGMAWASQSFRGVERWGVYPNDFFARNFGGSGLAIFVR